MSRPSIVIRCDAAPSIGFGHLVRSFALAREFADRECDVQFAIAENDEAIVMARREGFSAVEPPGRASREAWLDGIVSAEKADALVLDVRDGSATSAIEAIRHRGVLVADIDDPTDHRRAADLVFYPPIPQPASYDWRGFSGERLSGGEWVVLRRAFAEPPHRVARTRPVVLLTMGGSDPAGMTRTAVDALAGRTLAFDLAIVVGPGYGDREGLKRSIGRLERAPVILEQPDDMRAVMLGADLAAASFGVTAYELAATATPAVYLCLSDDHATSAAAIASTGAAVSLGVHTGTEGARLAGTIDALIADPDRLTRMGRAGRALVDGRGAARVAARVLDELTARKRGTSRT